MEQMKTDLKYVGWFESCSGQGAQQELSRKIILGNNFWVMGEIWVLYFKIRNKGNK